MQLAPSTSEVILQPCQLFSALSSHEITDVVLYSHFEGLLKELILENLELVLNESKRLRIAWIDYKKIEKTLKDL